MSACKCAPGSEASQCERRRLVCSPEFVAAVRSSRGRSSEDSVTQQYIFGEFSSFLGGLEPTAGGLGRMVDSLRREVEVSPLPISWVGSGPAVSSNYWLI